MAIAVFDVKELQKFIGKSRPVKEIVNTFNLIGTPTEDFNDEEIAVDVTPDRPDMLTVEGAGRAVGLFLGILEPRKYSADKAKTYISVDKVPMRPYIVAAIAKGLDVDEKMIKSMIQAQEKIHETFGRKRRKVAIGIHDYDKTSPPYSYRSFKHITFVPLDSDKEMTPQEIIEKHPKGIEYAWIYKNIDEYPIVADSKGVISFPPIINAERTRITDETKNILIEITGLSESAIRDALHIFATAFMERGAKIEDIRLKMLPEGESNSLQFDRKEKLDMLFLNKTLGYNFKKEEVVKLMRRMGYIAHPEEKRIVFDIPPYRAYMMHQVDLVEDVAIAYGYENFVPELPEFVTIGKEIEHNKYEKRLRLLLVGLGFNEVMTWTLTNKDNEKAALIDEDAAEIKNPKTREFTIYRTSLLPSLMSVLATNKTREMPLKIFEIGKVADMKGRMQTRIACAVMDNKTKFSDIKGIYEILNSSLRTSYREQDFKFMIPGRSIALLSRKGKKTVGWCGEVHPQVISNFGLEYPVTALEAMLE
ncbi:MAG: phenylalanine--tRNA ligase subunit beta [Candidatus Micrarchaeia archaeon]